MSITAHNNAIRLFQPVGEPVAGKLRGHVWCPVSRQRLEVEAVLPAGVPVERVLAAAREGRAGVHHGSDRLVIL